jgi:hypothetical protein
MHPAGATPAPLASDMASPTGHRRSQSRSRLLRTGRGVKSITTPRFAGFVHSGWHTYCLNMATGEPTVHDEIAQGLKEHPANKGMRFNILVTAVEVGGASRCSTLPSGWAPVMWSAT